MADQPHDSPAFEETLELPQIQLAPVEEFTPHAMNAREHPPEQVEEIIASICEFGWVWPILRRGDQTIGAGHGRREAAVAMFARGLSIRMWNGFPLPPGQLPYFDVSHWSEAKFKAYMLVDNRLAEKSRWDKSMLAAALDELRTLDFEVAPFGFAHADLEDIFGTVDLTGAAAGAGAGAGSLAAKFGVPPFSVLNAREGWWQERKAAWLALGIRSEVGRGENLLHMSDTALEPDPVKRKAMQEARAKRADAVPGGGGGGAYAGKSRGGEGYQKEGSSKGLTFGAMNADIAKVASGTSIFDPVLCELSYRWFCPPGGLILDPFAGGSVRGIVAAKLGREYVGFELRGEQVDANRAQASELCAEGAAPAYVPGDSRETIPPAELEADFVFTCPPYGDLEVYSDADDDLSAMEHADFLVAYREIIAAAISKLKPDRFAAVCVGDFRDKAGIYRNFVSDTIAAFQDAGAQLYNEAILVTAVGSRPVRAGRTFAATRKLGKTHQNVLVFVKGDPEAATRAVGAVDFGEAEDDKGAAPEEAAPS